MSAPRHCPSSARSARCTRDALAADGASALVGSPYGAIAPVNDISTGLPLLQCLVLLRLQELWLARRHHERRQELPGRP
ncbi:hypothetical protein LP419_24400 [Massilia sp. H-1]|nr:hypothetical protein LP419_24400 [Massilia sp. H-1]